jgi:hypothetical protein
MRHLALSAAIRHRIDTRLSRHHHIVVFGVVVDGKWANKRVASKKEQKSSVAHLKAQPNRNMTA